LFHVEQYEVPALAAMLRTRAALLGLTLTEGVLIHLADALAWLGPASLRLGLTNYRTPTAFVSNLVTPVLDLLRPRLAGHLLSPVLDFGAGSGALGLSLAILRPELQVVLADRRARVVQFLDLGLSRLHLSNCAALRIDLASPPAEYLRAYGLVLVRAFGPPTAALAHAAVFLQADGGIALWHQPPPPQPPDGLRLAETMPTSVDSLALTIYRHSG
jgi:16S rRNA G527 N7-methylase RsmG